MGLMRDCAKCGKELDIENLEGVSIPGEYMFDHISGLGYDTAKVYCRECSREVVNEKAEVVSDNKPDEEEVSGDEVDLEDRDILESELDRVLEKVRGTKYEDFIKSLSDWFSDRGSLTENQLSALRKFS